MNMTAGKRNIAVLGREAKCLRTITLLSTGTQIKIDPSRWAQTAQAKWFDAAHTSYLRVSKHKYEDKYLVQGMRAELRAGDKQAAVIEDVYELLPDQQMVPAALAKIAAHCGLSALVEDVK